MTLLSAGDTGRAGTPLSSRGAAWCAGVPNRHARISPNRVNFDVTVFR